MEVGDVIKNFLPAPEDLVPREEVVKITLAISKSSISFFKEQAKEHQTKYQKMIRSVVDGYADRYSKKRVA